MECRLVHARNLHDFLGPRPRKPRQGDYFVSDFIHELAVEVFSEETVNKINRWLHHLTTYRYRDDEHPTWNVTEILQPIVKGTSQFMDGLSTELAEPLMKAHSLAKNLSDALTHPRSG